MSLVQKIKHRELCTKKNFFYLGHLIPNFLSNIRKHLSRNQTSPNRQVQKNANEK